MAVNVLYVVTAAYVNYTPPGYSFSVRVKKGDVLALTAAEVTSIGAGNLRALNVPGNTTSVIGPVVAASPTHDSLGEASGVSNSS